REEHATCDRGLVVGERAGRAARRTLRTTGHGARPRRVERGPAGDPTPKTAPNPRTRSTRSRITGLKGPPLSTGPRSRPLPGARAPLGRPVVARPAAP